jgi:hypothetical protein
MNKPFWIIGASAIALIAAGTIYAKQMRDTAVDTTFPTAKTSARTSGATSSPTSAASRILVPQGTMLAISMGTGLSTKTASVGDRFVGTIASPVSVGGRVAIPQGSSVTGHVILAQQPGKASGRGMLQLQYDQVTFGGHSYDLNTHSELYQSASGTTKDVVLIGGGAVTGGIVGAVVGGKGAVAKGAAAGAAAGTGASLLTRGPQLMIEQGSVLNASLDQDLSVRRS